MIDVSPERGGDWYYYLERPKDYEIMQFTGLKDKNGVKIYEGDIIRWNDVVGSESKVFWHELGFWSANGTSIIQSHKITEVVGNIYESPELLQTLTDEK